MCNGEDGIGTWTSSWGFAVASLLPRLLSGSSLTFKAQLLLDVHIIHLTALVYSFEYSQAPYLLLPRQPRLGAQRELLFDHDVRGSEYCGIPSLAARRGAQHVRMAPTSCLRRKSPG